MARARTRDFDAMEQRRFEAARLLKQGVWPAEVARRLGVSRQSVHRWQQSLTQHGRRGLRQVGRAGRPPKLTPTDVQWLKRALTAGPEAHGHAMGLWTLKRVAQLIETQFGVRYSQPRVWQILRKLGWSCQRPTGQARQRDEAAIRDWKRTQWPTLKKTPRPKAAPSSSSTSRA
jgi:putative transposase